MTRNAAASEYRRTRALFIARQRALCTRFGTLATADQFDIDARRYLRDVEGITNPTPADFVRAARAMLAYLRRGESSAA